MKTLEAKGLRTTIYKVDDLQDAKEWYSNVFGIRPYFDQPFYAGFNIGGYELGLLPEKVNGVKTTNILAYWAVDDITDSFEIMISHGAKELEKPTDVGDGIMVALVRDPWGNVVGLIYNPYFQVTYPESTVVEWAPFLINKGVNESEVLSASNKVQKEFLIKQPGFIKRELLKKSSDEWVDLVYWKDHASAEAAMEASRESAVCLEYFALIQVESSDMKTTIEHFELVNPH